MKTKPKETKKEGKSPEKPLKPKQPHIEGAPNNQDPKAQYEDKDGS